MNVGGTKEVITAFYGLNRQNTALDGNNKYKRMEMQDELNLSSRAFPYICPKEPFDYFNIMGIGNFKSTFTLIDGKKNIGQANEEAVTVILYPSIDGNPAVPKIRAEALDGLHQTLATYNCSNVFPKTFVKMGARVVIHPDMVVFDTLTNTFSAMSSSATWDGLNSALQIYACDKKGNAFKTITPANLPPSGDATTYLVNNGSVYIWNANDANWVTTNEYYLKFIGENINIHTGQGVTITDNESYYGMTTEDAVKGSGAELVSGGANPVSWNCFIVKGHFNSDVAITGVSVDSDHTITISTNCPQMDFVCESGNRLWGCRYGNNLNEIYASALGDPYAFHLYEDTSMDSYTASIGEDGEWTGCIEYQGNPIFFKENMIYKVLGMYPAQYQITKYETNGLRKGDAACVFNQVLYYGSYEGICRYTGSLPQVFSHECGDIRAKAIGGCGHILYVADGEFLYTYDAERGLWHCESNESGIDCIFGYNGVAYFMDKKWLSDLNEWDHHLWTSEVGDETVDWYCVTPLLKISNPDSAYMSEIQIRTQFVKGTSLKVYANYDEGSYNEVKEIDGGNTWRDVSNHTWEEVSTLTWDDLAGEKVGVFPYTIHIRLKRSTTCRIKLVGKGDIRIISLTKLWRYGSDSTWR